jgi:hypothetical protein
MSFYTCFDWFKKLRLFVNVQNIKINVVLKRRVPLSSGDLFSIDYLPYFEKINIFFNNITKKV